MNSSVINDEIIKNKNGYSLLYLLTLGFATGNDGKGNYNTNHHKLGDHPIDNSQRF